MSNTKCQIKLVAYLLVASVVLVGFSSSRCLASLGDWSTWGSDNMITGELTIDTIEIDGVIINEPGLNADGTWAVPSTNTTMSWSVTAIYGGDAIADYFTYAYTFSEDAQGELSHMSIEVSNEDGLPAFALSSPDFFNSTIAPYDVDTHSDTHMPDPLYSIKWEETTDGEWTVEFDSARVPMWGDFYAKDGAQALYAYNTGFGHDPYSGNNLADYGYIARPDTVYVPVPGAVLLGMLGLGVAGVKLRKFA